MGGRVRRDKPGNRLGYLAGKDFIELLSDHDGGPMCPEGIALALRLFQNDPTAMLTTREVNAVADMVVGKAMARYTREALSIMGSEPVTANDANIFWDRRGEEPTFTFEPDTLRPGEAIYGDSDIDGSGASYARLK